MKQIAIARINCSVTEDNKNILKQALSREFEEPLQWEGNELHFILDSYFVSVTIDLLPDSQGYVIRACDECTKNYGWETTIVFLFLCGSILFSLKDITSIGDKIAIVGVIFFFVYGGSYAVNGWKTKIKVQKAFKNVSEIIN